jgi:hypothetical protein
MFLSKPFILFKKDDSLLYLDPHDVQNYEQYLINQMKDETYHTKTFLKLKFSNLDPSVALVSYRIMLF